MRQLQDHRLIWIHMEECCEISVFVYVCLLCTQLSTDHWLIMASHKKRPFVIVSQTGATYFSRSRGDMFTLVKL